MEHPDGQHKNIVMCSTFDFAETNMFCETEFYLIKDLQKNGFIFEEDKSLRFKYQIKKHNLQLRLEEAIQKNQPGIKYLDIANAQFLEAEKKVEQMNDAPQVSKDEKTEIQENPRLSREEPEGTDQLRNDNRDIISYAAEVQRRLAESELTYEEKKKDHAKTQQDLDNEKLKSESLYRGLEEADAEIQNLKEIIKRQASAPTMQKQ